jgi:hypothetical protein
MSDTNTRWEGYSDYQKVSIRVGETIENAVDAYTLIDSRHTENAPVEPEFAADARAQIKSAAMKLIPELENDREVVDFYDEVLDRWQGDDGYLQQLREVSLQQSCPDWLEDMVIDIRRAGWELGYLQAGRTERVTPEDPDEAKQQEIKQMFK